MKNAKTELLLLSDVVFLIREQAVKSKLSMHDNDDMAFEKGRLFALYEVLSLIKQESESFGIDPSEVGMKDFNPDIDIL